MKWFLCANNVEYMRYGAAAIATCPPDLEPIFLIDAPEDKEYLDKWVKWMISKNVRLVFHRTSFEKQIRDFYDNNYPPGGTRVALGAFMRCDIPLICDQLGIKDEYVFYSDTDVLFINNNINHILHESKPPFIAATVEHNPWDWNNFNSGVMVINVNGFKSLLPKIIDTIPKTKFPDVFDQTVLNMVLANHQWSNLLIEYNWKPYWDLRPEWSKNEIVLVHFHGPKPFSSPDTLKHLRGPHWNYWSDMFFRILDETGL